MHPPPSPLYLVSCSSRPLVRRLVQPSADAFAAKCSSVDQAYVANFGEEVVRSQPVFMLRWVLAYCMVVGRCQIGQGS